MEVERLVDGLNWPYAVYKHSQQHALTASTL
eukprot:COSAG02_NODE_40323_length_406_cov_29.615635_1_plen_30_part_10